MSKIEAAARARAARAQRGATLLGLLLAAVVAGALVLVAARAVPALLEYQAITRAVGKAAREGATAAEVRAVFDRAASVDDITSIRGRDLQVSQEGGRMAVRFAYDREIHLIGPAWLLLKYSGHSQ